VSDGVLRLCAVCAERDSKVIRNRGRLGKKRGGTELPERTSISAKDPSEQRHHHRPPQVLLGFGSQILALTWISQNWSLRAFSRGKENEARDQQKEATGDEREFEKREQTGTFFHAGSFLLFVEKRNNKKKERPFCSLHHAPLEGKDSFCPLRHRPGLCYDVGTGTPERKQRGRKKQWRRLRRRPRSHWKVPKDTFVVARCAGNTSIPLTSAEMGNAARNAACDLLFGSTRMGHANMRRRTGRKRRRRRRCRLFHRASSPPVAALERCKRHALSPSGCRSTCCGSGPLCCRIVPLLNCRALVD